MKRGRHAADDGSFGKSASMAAGRAAALLGVAVILGIVLLNALDDGPARVSAGGPSGDSTGTTDTTVPRVGASSTTTTTTIPARAPKDVKVLAINGTEVKGAAGKATDTLRAAQFNVLAPVSGAKGAATVVYFAPTYESDAAAVAGALGLPIT
ncbi:MAG: LytR C-terminal domain-containing protein, partial [Acidimicrobiales bacterium]